MPYPMPASAAAIYTRDMVHALGPATVVHEPRFDSINVSFGRLNLDLLLTVTDAAELVDALTEALNARVSSLRVVA